MTREEKKAAMYERIKTHGENLNRIFFTMYEPIALCKRLRRIESKLHRLAEQYCNGEIHETEMDAHSDAIMLRVRDILHIGSPTTPDVFFNQDPRGYALKIDDSYVREHNLTIYRDFGGYGIIAPDLTEE